MRELDFRMWDAVNKTMIDLKKITPLALSPGTPDGIFIPLGMGPVMQSIGLYDKNNRKIFEEDIVKRVNGYAQTETAVVRFDGCSFYARRISDRSQWEHIDWPSEFFENCEIIGNTYENSEIVKLFELETSDIDPDDGVSELCIPNGEWQEV